MHAMSRLGRSTADLDILRLQISLFPNVTQSLQKSLSIVHVLGQNGMLRSKTFCEVVDRLTNSVE